MNELIKNSIDLRKKSIYDYYEITDSNILEEINKFFLEVENYGNNCNDISEFEETFNTKYNEKYMDLLTKLATTCKLKDIYVEKQEIDSESIKEEMKDEEKYQYNEAMQPIRHIVHEQAMSEVRDIPVVSDILQTKQNIDFLNKFRRKKD